MRHHSGDIREPSSKVGLTAFVLIALSSADRLGEHDAAIYLNGALVALGHPGVPPATVRTPV